MNSIHIPFACVAFVVLVSGSLGQRVAPGVPPQHYQNQGQQHYEQPQVQYHQQQQPPVHIQQQVGQGQFQQQQVPPGVHPGQYQPGPPAHHQQQVPVHQQQQMPVHQQQVPVHQQQQVPVQNHHQGHHPPHHQPQVLNPNNIEHEREHIAEHAEVPIDTSKMSEQELQFHYFKMHDADSNNKLDGCELIKSLIHYHEQGSKEGHNHNEPEAPRVEEKIFSDEELVALIDPILQMDDINKDGFIDYPEFIRAQQKAQQKH